MRANHYETCGVCHQPRCVCDRDQPPIEDRHWKAAEAWLLRHRSDIGRDSVVPAWELELLAAGLAQGERDGEKEAAEAEKCLGEEIVRRKTAAAERDEARALLREASVFVDFACRLAFGSPAMYADKGPAERPDVMQARIREHLERYTHREEGGGVMDEYKPNRGRDG